MHTGRFMYFRTMNPMYYRPSLLLGVQLKCLCNTQRSTSFSSTVSVLLTLARACAAKGYCSRSVFLWVGRSVGRSVCRSVGRSVSLFSRFLSNRGCCRYQTWICATGARHSKSLERRSNTYVSRAHGLLFHKVCIN